MHNNNKDNMHNLNPWTDAMETNMQLNISVIIVVYELCSNIYSTPCLEKKRVYSIFDIYLTNLNLFSKFLA